MDIRTKLVLALISTSLLSMAAFGFFSHLLTTDLFLENSSRQLETIAAGKSREIARLQEGWQRALQRLSNGRIMSAAISVAAARANLAAQRNARTPGQEGYDTTEAPVGGLVHSELSAAFNTILQRESPSLLWLGVYHADGTAVAVSAGAPPKLPPLLADTGTFQQAAYRDAGGTISTMISTVVPGSPPGEGMRLALGQPASALSPIADDRAGLGITGECLLVADHWIDGSGNLSRGFLILDVGEVSRRDQSSSSWGPISEAPQAIRALFADTSQESTTETRAHIRDTDYAGTRVVASGHSLPGAPWRVVVKVDQAEEAGRVDELLSDLRVLGLALGGPVILVGVFLGIYLSSRIKQLAATVDRIRHGELDLRADVQGEDEITLLAQSLNEFLDQLDHSLDIFQLGALRVLVMENRETRNLLTELLKNWRMQAVIVSNSEDALTAIQQSQSSEEPIQLMVLDQQSGKGDGLQLLEELASRSDWQQCPVIMLAQNPESLDPAALKRLGVGHVLAKPVVASDLMEAILKEMGVDADALADMEDVFLADITPHHILLVEDSPIIQKVTRSFLENWGHSVQLATDGKQAVQCHRHERFDLVLMDLEMPTMSGLDATLAIRAQEADTGHRTPIVALTAKATKADREACMAAGMDDYVAKPVDPRVLYRMVNTHAAHAASTGGAANDVQATSTSPSPQTGTTPSDSQLANPSEKNMDHPPESSTQNGTSPIDWQVTKALTAGDMDLVRELIELFPAESARHIATIHKALHSKNADNLTRGAHSLKSTAAFFGAETLVEHARSMEEQGHNADFAGAQANLAVLEEETNRLNNALTTETPPE